MIKLNIESFDENEKEEKEKEDPCLEYKEKIQFLQNQLTIQKKQFEEKLKQEKEVLFNSIKEELQKQFEEKLKQALQEETKKIENQIRQQLEKEFEAKLNQKKLELEEKYKSLFQKVEEELIKKNNEVLDSIKILIVDNLKDILHTLSIKEENAQIVQEEIQSLLDKFREYKAIRITANPEVAKLLNFKNIFVKSDENLPLQDFKIEFDKFRIEKDHKEILNQVSNELKREITENS